MRQFFFNSIVFTIILAMTLLIIEIFFSFREGNDPYEWRYKYQFDELFHPKVNADIIIIGSSKAVRGINPKIIENKNRSVFNFALNGSNPEYYYNWYKYLFRNNYKKPKLLIFEVSWFMFNEEFMWRNIYHDSKFLPKSEVFRLICKNKSPKIDNYKLFSSSFNLLEKSNYELLIQKKNRPESLHKFYNGYNPLETIDSVPLNAFPDFNPENQRVYFEKLLSLLYLDSVNVILVNLPDNLSQNLIDSETYSINNKFIEQSYKKYEFDFFQFQDSLQFVENQDSIFHNWNHLNEIGAKIFSDKINTLINEPYHNNVYEK